MGGSVSVDEKSILSKNSNAQYTIREANAGDYAGFVKVLGVAYRASAQYPLSQEKYTNALQTMAAYKPYHRILVITDNKTNEIVGTGRLIIRPTVMSSDNLTAHLEEVSIKGITVDSTKSIFQILLATCQDIAVGYGCHKVSYVSHGSYQFYEGLYKHELNHFSYVCSDDDKKRVAHIISKSPTPNTQDEAPKA